MNTNYSASFTASLACIAALTAGAALAAPAQAADHEVTVNIPVSITGLDLAQPAAARKAYLLIQHAARSACTHGNRVDLAPPPSFSSCYETALGKAVGSAHRLQISVVYLESHTPRDAATYGIDTPIQMAAQ